MFAARYFPPRLYPARYFPKTGASSTVTRFVDLALAARPALALAESGALGVGGAPALALGAPPALGVGGAPDLTLEEE